MTGYWQVVNYDMKIFKAPMGLGVSFNTYDLFGKKNQGCEIFTGPPGLLKIYNSKAQLLLQTKKRFPFYSTGSMCGEYTRYQWNPLTKCSDTWYRLFYDSKYAGSQWFETPWHSFHCNGYPTPDRTLYFEWYRLIRPIIFEIITPVVCLCQLCVCWWPVIVIC